MFREMISPTFMSTRLCYSLWSTAPTMLPACSLDAVEPHPDYRPETSWVHYTTSCNTQSSAPEDGWNRPKHVELIGIINKPLLLHLVGFYIIVYIHLRWPALWSSGQSFWLQIQRSRVRFPALPDFLSSSGSGTGSTQPREVNWAATWIKSSGSGPENRD